jgi:SNF2 family DNA or RNA helicase
MSKVFVPHDYQRPAINHVRKLKRGALWAPMGGGKTVVVLSALLDLDLIEPVFPILVLAPKRVSRTTWPAEIAKWAHTKHLRIVYVGGTRQEREAALRVKADVYTMAYDNLVWLVDHYKTRWPFRTVVADELTRLKSFRIRQGSKRAGALGKVAHTLVDRFIGLTGTPAPNGLKDLWGQMWFIDHGHRLGHTFTAFEHRWFMRGYDGYSLQPMVHSKKEIEALLRDVCLTVEGLPVDEPIVTNLYVELPPDAVRQYREMEKHMATEIEGEVITAELAITKTGKLLQLCNGAAYIDEDAKTWAPVHDAKLEALESVIEEAAGMPVLVSYSFRSDLERILKRFPQARHLDDDPRTIVDWNAGTIPVLVAHPQSAGHGLNLQDGGNILAFFGLDWNLEGYQQITERIGPLRQKQSGYDRPVFVYHILVRGGMDEIVLERLQGKITLQEALLAAMRRAKGSAHADVQGDSEPGIRVDAG